MDYHKITPSVSDARFPSFLQGFNQRWEATNCQAIYLCHSASGVVAALNDATLHYGKHVKIKSGGHCYENFIFSPDTLAVIDITPIDDYGHDLEKGYYLGSGGTNWSAFQALFRDYGKVLPAGSCYSVGLGGHICGGGYGLLSRENGLTVDWLTAVDVVVKPGLTEPARLIHASKYSELPEHRELFWAHCGGGGGNFGVITHYYFKNLPDAPKSAMITTLGLPWEKITIPVLTRLLDWYAAFSASADNHRQFGLLKLNHIAAGEIHLVVQTIVKPGETETAIYDEFVVPMLAQLNKITRFSLMTQPGIGNGIPFSQADNDTLSYTFYEAVQYLNGSGPNQRGKYKSAYMKKAFPLDQIETIYNYLNPTSYPPGMTQADFTQCVLQVDSYGGRINTVSDTHTPIPQRSSIMKLQYQIYWTEPSRDTLILNWMKQFYASVYQLTGGTPNPDKDTKGIVDGCYYNYPDTDLNSPPENPTPALNLYFGRNLQRLQAVKKTWDPHNYFNSSQSITID